MCIRDRSKPVDEKRLFRNMKEALYQIEMETEPVPIETKDGIIAVSYTHLDVYKRQE